MGGRGKGGKKNQNKINEEKQPSHNKFKILEEEDGNNGMNLVLEDSPAEKEKDDSMEEIPENNKLKEDLLSTMELDRDH